MNALIRKPRSILLAFIYIYTVNLITAASDCSERLVYIDLGANWANTLRLFQDLNYCPHSLKWEIYSFEALPLIAPYVDNFTRYLNGRGEKPRLFLPPSGSSVDIMPFAKNLGCHKVPPLSNSRCLSGCKKCVYSHLSTEIGNLQANTTLEDSAVVAKRLKEAMIPNEHGRPRYTFIPAAVGVDSGHVQLSWHRVGLIHGGGTAMQRIGPERLDRIPQAYAQESRSVISIDVASWIVSNFNHADYLVVKMDIEGLEFGIIEKLSEHLCVIDHLLWQCHHHYGSCNALESKFRRLCPQTRVTAESPHGIYSGLDSSTKREVALGMFQL